MLNKIKNIRNIKIENLLIVFFLLQPIVDIYRSFFGDTINICGIAIEEIVNTLLILCTFLLLIYQIITNNKQSIKKKKYIVYVFLLIIYLTCHYINISRFNNDIYWLSNINFITENYYIFRAYLLPIIILFLVYNSNISDKKFNMIVTYVVLFMSAVIIVTNIFKISLVSYSLDNVFIEGNIFSWFNMGENVNYASYTSKGWFYATNEISALLLSLAPIIIKQAIRKNNWKYYVLVGMQVISMIMLGTKTAAIGILLIVAMMTIVLAIISILKIEKNNNAKISIGILIAIFILGICIYNISPTKLKLQSDRISAQEGRTAPETKYGESSSNNNTNEPENTLLSDYIKKYSYNYCINEWFLEIYPINQDSEFWEEIISRDARLNSDNRNFKIKMIDRIRERNNNNFDILLGMGYTSNVPYTEKDYYYQYYIFGIIGMILLMGPCLLIGIYSGTKILIKYKEKMNLENISILMALGCMFMAGYLSGHVWGMVINMYFMALYAGKILNNVIKKEEM